MKIYDCQPRTDFDPGVLPWAILGEDGAVLALFLFKADAKLFVQGFPGKQPKIVRAEND